MSVDIDDENEPPFKLLCAHYGLAMYMVQVLEHGLVNALVWLDLYPRTNGKWTDAQFEHFYKARFGETLKALADRVSKHAVMSQELKDLLAECNRRRRLLAHHFFIDAADYVGQDNVDHLIERLVADRDYFHETDKLLDSTMEPILVAHGLTPEYRQREQVAYENSLRSQREGI